MRTRIEMKIASLLPYILLGVAAFYGVNQLTGVFNGMFGGMAHVLTAAINQ